MNDDDTRFAPLADALLADAASIAPPPGLSDAVMARLDDAPATEEDRLALAPEVDPELGGRPVAAWLREETAAQLAEPPAPWAAMTAAVLERAERDPAAERGDVLAPEARGPTVGALLREERAAELDAMEGRWSAFASQIDHQLKAEAPGGELDEQAVALLRADVDDELRALSPAFEEEFQEEVDRRIFQRGHAEVPVWRRLQDWLQDLTAPARIGWGVGLAGAAATLALVISTGPGSTPDALLAPRAALTGEVSVDAVSFEGDVTMIPDEGVTVVVLSGV